MVLYSNAQPITMIHTKKISEKSLKNFLEEKDCYVFEC
jgi:hypothetical protein